MRHNIPSRNKELFHLWGQIKADFASQICGLPSLREAPFCPPHSGRIALARRFVFPLEGFAQAVSTRAVRDIAASTSHADRLARLRRKQQPGAAAISLYPRRTILPSHQAAAR